MINLGPEKHNVYKLKYYLIELFLQCSMHK
jgi:hypothetical protein